MANAVPSMRSGLAYKFIYKNYRGETAWRYVLLERLEYTSFPEYYGEDPQWFIRTFDYIKGAPRTFALNNIEVMTIEPLTAYEIKTAVLRETELKASS
jgi:hypothetical protein